MATLFCGLTLAAACSRRGGSHAKAGSNRAVGVGVAGGAPVNRP
mgnify:CR=1 FL=1